MRLIVERYLYRLITTKKKSKRDWPYGGRNGQLFKMSLCKSPKNSQLVSLTTSTRSKIPSSEYSRKRSACIFFFPPQHRYLTNTLRHPRQNKQTIGESPRSRAQSRSFAEEYNESFTQMDVHHVRNELEEIRIQRTREGHIGCNCRKLQVYLLPPGGGGKKANSRRMNFPKLKEELRKRNILPKETKTREELELILHEAVEKEPCCSSEDCFCYRNNLNCQDDACSCWWPSHQTQKTKNDHAGTMATPEQIKERCKNKFGMHITDVDSIDAFRKDLLCQVIGESKKL